MLSFLSSDIIRRHRWSLCSFQLAVNSEERRRCMNSQIIIISRENSDEMCCDVYGDMSCGSLLLFQLRLVFCTKVR